MTTINFVPNDYVQHKQSNRVNSLYLILLVAVLGGIGVTFSILKMRQRSVSGELGALESKMGQAREQIAQLEELKNKRNTRMKVMLMTASLIEPVRRSIVLACLTNNLPSGVSLLETRLEETEKKVVVAAPVKKKSKSSSKGKYKKETQKTAKPVQEIPESEIFLEISGLAPSDIEVANYIANLSLSSLLGQVQLVSSKEVEIDGVKFREFQLKTQIKPNLVLTKEDIDRIRQKREGTI